MNTSALVAIAITGGFRPVHSRALMPIESIALASSVGMGKRAKDMVAFQIMDDFLETKQKALDTGKLPGPFHVYKRVAKGGKFVVEKACQADTAARLIQLIA